LEELARAVVAVLGAGLDAAVEAVDGRLLQIQVELELLVDGLADEDLAQALQVGQPLEVEHALDELVRVLHLVDALGADLLPEPLVAPVLAHAGVHEVLVDAGELAGENLVQEVDDLVVAFHAASCPRRYCEDSTWRCRRSQCSRSIISQMVSWQ